MIAGETWKSIKGYEGYYEVSNKGNVRSVQRIRIENNCHGGRTYRRDQGKLLRPTNNGYGYLVIGLRKNGKRKNHYVHRLVAEAFCENPNGKTVVNHIDRNKRNNDSKNLEWVTTKENVQLAAPYMRHEKRGKASNTGEKYITFYENKGKSYYRVNVHSRNAIRACRQFKTLKDAVKYRNEVMSGGV